MMLGWRLGEGSLNPWDEAFYAEAAKEMVQSGDWLTPHYNFEPTLEKPPLVMWSIAVVYQLFGVNEFHARIPTALAGVGVVVLVFLIGNRLFGRSVGLLGVAVLLTSFQFVNNARWCTTDVLLTFSILLALHAYLHVRSGEDKWWYVVGASFALGFLTKGPAMVVAPVVIVLDLCFEHRLGMTLRSRHLLGAMLVGFTIGAPWFVSMFVLHRELLLDRAYFNMIVRTTQVVQEHQGGRDYYIGALRSYDFPWFYLLPFVLLINVRDNLERRAASRVLLILTGTVFGLCTVMRTKIEWYILPMYPALAILTGVLLQQAFRSRQSVEFAGLAVASLVVALMVPHKQAILFACGIILLVAFFLYRRKYHHPSLAMFLIGFLILSGAIELRPLYHKKDLVAARLARLVAKNHGGDRTPLLLHDVHNLREPTVVFYCNRPVQTSTTLEEFKTFLLDGQQKEALLPASELQTLSASCDIHVMAEDDSFAYVAIRRKNDG